MSRGRGAATLLVVTTAPLRGAQLGPGGGAPREGGAPPGAASGPEAPERGPHVAVKVPPTQIL